MKHVKNLATITELFMGGQPGGLQHTLTPQCNTLLLVSLADAVITVAVHVVAGVAVMQVDVGGAVRAGTSAELRQITRVTGLTAWSACWLQLHSNVDSKQQSLSQRPTVKLRQLEKCPPNSINGADLRV